jgi:hypothetical protein
MAITCAFICIKLEFGSNMLAVRFLFITLKPHQFAKCLENYRGITKLNTSRFQLLGADREIKGMGFSIVESIAPIEKNLALAAILWQNRTKQIAK